MYLQRGSDRPAAVAGAFYPGSEAELARTVDELLARGREEQQPLERPVPALVVPHAGYVYSGHSAAIAFAARPEAPARVILVGPAHRVYLSGVSAGDFAHYRSPVGSLPVDRAAVRELEEAGLVQVYPEAHASEHCLEVMLPFILRAWGELPIVPLLAGAANPKQVRDVLAAALRPGDLLLVSTDLSHFETYDAASAHDRATLDHVLAGRWDRLAGQDACGHRGLSAAMLLADEHGWEPQLLDYRNSGDTAGDRSRVVGYGSLAYLA